MTNTSSSKFNALINESIFIEHNVSELYFLFYKYFPDDAAFWWQLVEEEKNHAALIKSGRDYFKPGGQFPDRLLHTNHNELRAFNKVLTKLTSTLTTAPPSRETAFNIAYTTELSAGELHFQHFMNDIESMSPVEDLFSRLNRGDIKHAKRIRTYMQTHHIPFDSHFTLP